MQCVILAGGLGSRMRPLTAKTPKTLLPVSGIPFADYQLRWAAQHGVTEVVYSIARLGDQVRAYAGDGQRWGLTIRYVEDGDQFAGPPEPCGVLWIAGPCGIGSWCSTATPFCRSTLAGWERPFKGSPVPP